MPFLLKYYPNNPFTDKDADRSLYHYTTADALISINQSQSIRFTKSNYSNDKREGLIVDRINEAIYKIDQQQLIGDCNSWQAFKHLCHNYQCFLERFTLDKSIPYYRTRHPSMFNFCLSKSYNDDRLWREYAKTEVCLEFSESFLRRALDWPSDCNNLKYTAASSADIVYRLDEQINILTNLITNSYKEFKPLSEQFDLSGYQSVFHDVAQDFLLCSYVFKDEIHWVYESEYRFFLIWFRCLQGESVINKSMDKHFIVLDFKDNPAIWEKMLKRVLVRDVKIQTRLATENISATII